MFLYLIMFIKERINSNNNNNNNNSNNNNNNNKGYIWIIYPLIIKDNNNKGYITVNCRL